ncbi:receptor protein-tyrosine kinase CEPR2-like [Mangifera indica]|uniref:receptor protein-tyrosine kinase CEPR2-like n=1 Tax=Mangifera indica TaxID=29780 RepID=UPI001CF95D4C|nr:receptor protein-tyrosine kinase CEPR2-like [Mangifera indica]XP_044475838.1 receptor protein-tyrosine kinase CEPR2-like [Mangifera indica]XP_044475839.1 receptor protein-tyrosine kinase CEPR2-like [Mangifera indica]
MPGALAQSLQVLTVLCFIACIFPPSVSLSVETQALLQFKSQLKDPLGVLESWKDSADSPCQFMGITCDLVTGKVTEISLDNKSLSGEISPSISVLDNLTKLLLPSNSISGKLPSEIGNCSNLKVLNLTGNYMVGVIPDLSMVKNLEILDLSINGFKGRFPSWVANLTRLVSLGLGSNNYDEGEIPASIGNLNNLNWLFLADCNLKGEIPESVFELKELDTLDLSTNRISGILSRSISNLQKLTKIELFGNNLTGEIPPELAELTLLREIDISNNGMSGELPEGIGNLKNLTVFQCYKNKFSGKLPSGFGDMQHLIGFSIYGNSFYGEFPKNFGRYSPLLNIDISDNQFSGSFPKFLCEAGKLTALLALNNNFSGEVSASYGECKTLQRLRINRNRLSGMVPDGIWALPKAGMIDLGDNDFIGGISPNISFSTSLHQLVLQNNRFSGELPSGLGMLSNLDKLILHKNNFSGEIPSEIGALKQLSFLHLEDNSLTGSIPMELGYCTKLVDLNLARNLLSGNIPLTFSQMSSLNALNLSENKLTGLIPDSLRKLKLSSIDLSRNQLSGSVPSYLLRMGGDKAFIGNKGLCLDQSTKLLMNSGLDVCPGKHSQTKFKNTWVLFCVIAASLVALAGILLVSYKKFKHKADMQNVLDEEKAVDQKWRLASFHQMDIDADEICNLDEDNLIGIGGTGKVYRLDLKKNVGTVAVKQLWKSDGVKVLAAELGILGKIRHRNILKLYAYLHKGGSNFLVFEYMANGNLSEALHRKVKGGQPELDWCQRYKIALGTAKGIAYLHHDCSPPIIHRDIKSSNILLDEDHEPKIADFGVAKISDKSCKSSEYSCFAGTHGYIAPEMAYTYKVTEKSDVYGFGVVLLELVTGRRPIEDEYGDGKDIVYWVSTHLNNRENVLKVLDKEVVSESMQEDMIRVLKIGVACTSKLPSLRPSMREAVKMLVDADPCIYRSSDSGSDKSGKITL